MTSLGKDFFAEKINGSPPLVNEVFTNLVLTTPFGPTPTATVPVGTKSIMFKLEANPTVGSEEGAQVLTLTLPLGFDILNHYVELNACLEGALNSSGVFLYSLKKVAEVPAVPGGAAATPGNLVLWRHGGFIINGATVEGSKLDKDSYCHIRMIPFTTKTLA